jgi:CRISPR-associated endonuclease/helicase Cas3
MRFLPQKNRNPSVTPTSGTVYLICTSAGEVGVNISADHLVCDLSTFESMAQRFGRVNRFGNCSDTEIHVVHPTEFDVEGNKLDAPLKNTLDLLRQLNADGSPFALGGLDSAQRLAAFSPEPQILPASDILFDSWALTTIRGKLPGRPPVEPYLHGVADWEPPQAQVAWREEVGEIAGELLARHKPEYLLDDYPLKPHELLRDRSDRVFKHLVAIAKRHPDDPVWLLNDDGTVDDALTIATLADDKAIISNRTVLLSPGVGGLKDGMLDGETDSGNDVADEWKDDGGPLRKRVWEIEGAPEQKMALQRKIVFENLDDEDEDAAPAKVWWWFVRRPESPSEHSRDACELKSHLGQVHDCARKMVQTLALPKEVADAAALAAKFHDLGKNRDRWQRSIGNDCYPDKVYAKSGRLPDGKMMRPRDFFKDYRHEFGSLLELEQVAEFGRLTAEVKELVRHFIAAHHGRARPHFGLEEGFDPEAPQDRWSHVTREVPRRYARLQRKYGRWGLAYLESLVRAADWAASASASEAAENPQEAKS